MIYNIKIIHIYHWRLYKILIWGPIHPIDIKLRGTFSEGVYRWSHVIMDRKLDMNQQERSYHKNFDLGPNFPFVQIIQ